MKRVSPKRVAAAMSKYGGNFVRGLAIALRNADEDNVMKIKNAWPDYWEHYERIAVQMREEKTK